MQVIKQVSHGLSDHLGSLQNRNWIQIKLIKSFRCFHPTNNHAINAVVCIWQPMSRHPPLPIHIHINRLWFQQKEQIISRKTGLFSGQLYGARRTCSGIPSSIFVDVETTKGFFYIFIGFINLVSENFRKKSCSREAKIRGLFLRGGGGWGRCGKEGGLELTSHFILLIESHLNLEELHHHTFKKEWSKTEAEYKSQCNYTLSFQQALQLQWPCQELI